MPKYENIRLDYRRKTKQLLSWILLFDPPQKILYITYLYVKRDQTKLLNYNRDQQIFTGKLYYGNTLREEKQAIAIRLDSDFFFSRIYFMCPLTVYGF